MDWESVSESFPTVMSFKMQQILISTNNWFLERKKDPSLEAADDKSIQDWDLKDVIFVEDKRNIPVGRVLKVDDYFNAVL